MEGQIRHGLLYSVGSGLSGQLTGAVFGRQLLAKPLLKTRPGENWTPEIAFFFLQLASKPSALEPHRDAVHGDAIGLKSYFTDAEI